MLIWDDEIEVLARPAEVQVRQGERHLWSVRIGRVRFVCYRRAIWGQAPGLPPRPRVALRRSSRVREGLPSLDQLVLEARSPEELLRRARHLRHLMPEEEEED